MYKLAQWAGDSVYAAARKQIVSGGTGITRKKKVNQEIYVSRKKMFMSTSTSAARRGPLRRHFHQAMQKTAWSCQVQMMGAAPIETPLKAVVDHRTEHKTTLMASMGFMPDRNWFTYLLKCSDGSLYCGVTKNVENRLTKHNEGTASKYTRSRLPVKFAAVKGHLTKREAYQLEYKIKKTPTHKKIVTLNAWKFEN